jgi:uncharacterized protein with GYD domain
MPKFLMHAYYTSEGLKGLKRDRASGRKATVSNAIGAFGGKLEAMHYSFGDDDVIAIVDLPDNASASALSIAISSTGLMRTKTIPLLKVEEMDDALSMATHYKGPGR